MNQRRLQLCLLGISAAFAGCNHESTSTSTSPVTASSAANLTTVRLALNWFPEAEHGGFYAAMIHGHYTDAGLDVEIIPGGPGAPVVQEVVTGRVEFGVVNADQILLGRVQGAEVVALMAPIQHSPRCIMVHGASGIKRFEDLKHLTLAWSEGKPFAMFMKQQLALDGVQFVPYPGNVAEFLNHPDFAQQAYSFSEPFVAEQQGGDPEVLMVSDIGFDPYTSLLFTRTATTTTSPDLVRRMVAASVRGWQSYLDDPTATNARIHEENPAMELDVLAFGATALHSLCLPDGNTPRLGTMESGRWAQLHQQLVEIGAIDGDRGSVANAWTADYLPAEQLTEETSDRSSGEDE